MKQKMRNRVVGFLLAAALAVTSMPMQPLAAGETRATDETVDWENIIDDFTITVEQGGTSTQYSHDIEHLRDGNPDTAWVRDGDAGGSTSLLKFTLPEARELKKVDMYFEKGKQDSATQTTVILLDKDQNEITGTKHTGSREDGYEYSFAEGTVMKEFYVQFIDSPWALIGEMQVYAERDEGIDITQSITSIELCDGLIEREPDGYGNTFALENMRDGNIKTVWAMDNIPSATLKFTLPKAETIQKIKILDEGSGEDYSESMTVMDANKNPLGNTVTFKPQIGGCIWIAPKDISSLTEFYIKIDKNGWPRIAEIQIFAKRDGKETENIAGDCTPATKVGDQTNYDTKTDYDDGYGGGFLENINNGTPDKNWMSGGANWPATVRFQIPEGKKIKKVVVRCVVDSNATDRKLDLKLEYSTNKSDYLKLISEKTQHELNQANGNGVYEIEFASSKSDMKYLYVTISNPNTTPPFWSGLNEVEIYAEKQAVLVNSIEITAPGNQQELTIGNPLQLTEKVLPDEAENKDVEWQSSNTNIATVDDNGLVTGVAKGSVTITATATDGSGVKGTYDLTVKGIPITGITLAPASLSMHIGESQKITATVAPENASDKSVLWESDTPTVATVDEDGTVTAVGVGTATITAKGNTETTVTKTAKVTVTKSDILASSITINSGNKTELSISETLELTAAVEPSGAVQAVTWSSDKPNIAKVDNKGIVTALNAGTVTITATAKDESGVSKSITLTVKKGENGRIDLANCELSAKNALNHGIELAIDGKKDTYWQSIPCNGEGDDANRNMMYDHNRYIDIKLDGTYDLTGIKIFNNVNNSFNNYYIYASEDGVNYDKIVSKTSNTPAEADGDSYTISTTAAYLRLNMAYNSYTFVTNLAEIELYGAKSSGTVPTPDPISVESWNDSKWKTEWEKFEANENGYADEKVLTEMSSLVGRVLGDKWKDSFLFEFRDSLDAEGNDVFELKDGEDGTIVIRGNNGIAMASGFNYYLKNYVNIDYSPMYSSNTNLTAIKPVGKKIVKEAQFDLRYALNFCTYSYTMSFWNWDEYEAFLDWAAMNGINLILDIVGQEEVLRETFSQFGYSDEEIKDYISGPAYFAWFYMQNLYSIGGPLPDAWFAKRVELGRQMHDRMQTFGMTPVLQGFAGQVPETFAEKNAGTIFAPEDEWSGFTRPAIIKTFLTDEEKAAGYIDRFSEVADKFYAAQTNVFGDISHYYATDPFHEGGKASDLTDDTDPTGSLRNEEMSRIYKAVQDKMLSIDSKAIWVMQQWQNNLNAAKISKLLPEHMLALDLQANMRQQHGCIEDIGADWIYCMLHNFGGRMGMDGDIPRMASDPLETFQKSDHMVGIGMSPEAMENSPVVYELLFDTTWSKDPIDYREWTKKYAARRADGTSETLEKAWEILLETAYDAKDAYYQGAAETVINARPSDTFSAASTWGHSGIYYDKKDFDQALLLLIENYEEFAASPAYKYDLADVAEQVLCNAAVEYHKLMVQAKNDKNLTDFEKYSEAFLELIDLSDQILSTTDGFLLGTWIEAARKMIENADDWTKDLFEFNARSLVTTWGGERVGSLKDYSNRKWAGLTSSFYKERWEIWVRNRTAELTNEPKDPADEKAESNWFLWEYQWVNRKSDDKDANGNSYGFATTPTTDDLGALAKKAYDDFSCTNLDAVVLETENIAEGKSVSVGSSQTADGDPKNLTDGNSATGWKAAGAEPHTMTVDFGEARQVNNITILLENLAKTFPYTWEVEYLNTDGSTWISLGTNKTADTPTMATTTDILAGIITSQIRLTIETADVSNSPVYVAEISAIGPKTESESEFENLALGITPTANCDTSSDSSLSDLTDGDASSLWKAAGNNYPTNIDLDLGKDAYVDTIEVFFEKSGLPFKFCVTVTDLDGNTSEYLTEYKDNNTALPKKSFKADIGAKAKAVRVSLLGNNGQGEFPGVWPALAEIKVMGKPIYSETNLSGNPVTSITVSGDGGATSKILQDNKQKDTEDASAYDALTLNEEVVFDLGQTHYLSHVNFVFEKVGLALKYDVYAEDASGEREKLASYDSPAHQLTDSRVVRVPIGKDVRKIIFIHKGNGTAEESPTAYLAEPRLYGFEAYGVAKSSASAAQAEGLTGTEGAYQAAANTPVTIALERPADVNMIRILRADGETKALNYTAEYFDMDSEEWVTFADRSDGQDAAADESFAILSEGAFTNKIRLKFTEQIQIKDISIYNTDPLLGKIIQIENTLTELKYDGTHGSYKPEEKKKLESVIAEAKKVSGGDPAIVNEWLDKLDMALIAFYRNGPFYVDRSSLLELMASIGEFIETHKPTGQELTDIEKIRSDLREAYETYNTKQSDIDKTVSEKRALLLTAGTKAEETTNPELAAARKELEDYLKQLEDMEFGESTPELWQAYEEAKAAAADMALNWNATSSAIALIKDQLATAVQKLNGQQPPQPPQPEVITEITVQAADGSGKTAIEEGGTLQLTALPTPSTITDRTLQWTSSDTAIATVDQNGLVTAKAVGDVEITVTTDNEADASGSIRLKVTKKQGGSEGPEGPDDPDGPILVQEIKVLAQDNKTTLNEDETVQLTTSVLPENADNKAVEWSSENDGIASVSASGLVTAKATGTVKITATAADGSKKAGSISLTILPKVNKTYEGETFAYQVTASSESEKTITVQKSKDTKAKNVTIPDSVMIGGQSYLVTAIAPKAFQKHTKLKQVVIGANIKTIGKKAFYNCKKLKKVTIQSTKVTSIGKQAFGKIVKKAKITVPKAKYAAYKKLLQKKAKTAKTVKIVKAKK